MKAVWPWLLGLAAAVAGYASWGWPGVALAMTVVVFWLLLQFNRALRVMRQASSRPKGQVDSAVMLHAKLQLGMRLAQVMQLSRSFGEAQAAPSADSTGAEESYLWTDNGGARVTVQLRNGKVSAWTLQRDA